MFAPVVSADILGPGIGAVLVAVEMMVPEGAATAVTAANVQLYKQSWQRHETHSL